MRTALLADIHANLEALEACLAHAHAAGAERFVFLGDLIGYGADPAACLDIVMAHAAQGAPVVLGNHDAACLGYLADEMHTAARFALEWTRAQLDEAQTAFLAGLPLQASQGDCLYVHASPFEAPLWPYVLGPDDAADALGACIAPLIFVGHVHLPILFSILPEAGRPVLVEAHPGEPVVLAAHRRWLCVVGSTGQPRDGNPAACYALHDDAAGTLTQQRVDYDVRTACAKILAAGLPPWLGERLLKGE